MKTYIIYHTDKSGLRNYEIFPVEEKWLELTLRIIEKQYGTHARENAIIRPY